MGGFPPSRARLLPAGIDMGEVGEGRPHGDSESPGASLLPVVAVGSEQGDPPHTVPDRLRMDQPALQLRVYPLSILARVHKR